jgi:GTP cyclohydrolase I
MAEIIGARFTPSPRTSSSLYISDRWHQAGWLGRHGFQQENHCTSLIESSFVKVLSVRRMIAEGYKPFTVYSFKCDPYPTFLINGHLSHNCEHHLLPFVGVAHIAYIPREGRIVGLSKLARVADLMAKKPQIQERLTTEIADLLFEELDPTGVLVVIEAEHMCMEMRGVKKPGSKTITSALRGGFLKDPRTRAEAMALIRNHH